MDRKNFIKKGLVGMTTIVGLPTIIAANSKDDGASPNPNTGDCELAPRETKGPFPIKTPADLVRENIISDRSGVALLITLTIVDQNNNCSPLEGVFVDVWHCDAEGNYSEYGGIPMQATNYKNKDFLRGRQSANSNGQVSFISIFPGWYRGRAPHIHVEVLDANEKSIRATQIAFPKSVCDIVYATSGYKGTADTLNARDNVFSDSLNGNMADSIAGNTTDGYTLLKTIVV
jgi:protocatechuate 3,4-dioxygenase beta subunit